MSIETTIQKVTAYEPSELFGANAVDSILAEIRAEALSYAPDLSTDASRKQIASVAAKVAKAKTGIDAIGKSLVDPLKARAKIVDDERKRYRDALDALKNEVRAPLTEWEEAQAKIVADQNQRLFELQQATDTTNSMGEVLSVQKLEEKLSFVEACSTVLDTETYGNGLEKARQLVEVGTIKITKAIETRKTLDLVAAQQSAANVETPEQRAQREREIAENAAQAERDKQSAEAKRKAEEDYKRASDAEHVRAIKTAAWKSLCDTMPDLDTQIVADIIRAIADGKVRHVSIQI